MERFGGWCNVGDGYGIVLKSTMYQRGLSIEAKAIYALLATHADAEGYCFPQVETICEALEIGEDRFRKHMNKLKAAGLVEVTRKRNGYKFSNNVYRLTDRCDISSMDFPSPYNGGMIPPKSSPDFTGLDDTSPCLSSPCGGGTNIPPVNSTTINKTTYKQNIYALLGGKLTERRRLAGLTRGKLTDSQIARMYVDGLLKSGFTEKQLLDFADRFPAGKCFDSWWHFEKFCLSERGKG